MLTHKLLPIRLVAGVRIACLTESIEQQFKFHIGRVTRFHTL
jgi:hypothetical protein